MIVPYKMKSRIPETSTRGIYALGIQVPSQKVYGVDLEGPGAVPEKVRLDP